MNDLERKRIAQNFSACFENWDIHLPKGALESAAPGGVSKAGWHIRWVFGSDEDGEYLEYLAGHRMTNESRSRLYASGEQRGMPARQDLIMYPAGAAEEEQKHIDAAFYEENGAITEELHRIGLITDV
jgi:hypothetical protein